MNLSPRLIARIGYCLRLCETTEHDRELMLEWVRAIEAALTVDARLDEYERCYLLQRQAI